MDINAVEKSSDYELELEKAINEIRKIKAKLVCIQLPDGMKPLATEIARVLEKNTGAEVIIWLGSCFGACDIPNVNADIIIQWGHSQSKEFIVNP